MSSNEPAPIPETGVGNELKRRLRFIEGQAGGVCRMIEDGRDWGDVLNQLLAIQSAARASATVVVQDRLIGQIRESVNRAVLSCVGQCEFCNDLEDVVAALDRLDYSTLVGELPFERLVQLAPEPTQREGGEDRS